MRPRSFLFVLCVLSAIGALFASLSWLHVRGVRLVADVDTTFISVQPTTSVWLSFATAQSIYIERSCLHFSDRVRQAVDRLRIAAASGSSFRVNSVRGLPGGDHFLSFAKDEAGLSIRVVGNQSNVCPNGSEPSGSTAILSVVWGNKAPEEMRARPNLAGNPFSQFDSAEIWLPPGSTIRLEFDRDTKGPWVEADPFRIAAVEMSDPISAERAFEGAIEAFKISGIEAGNVSLPDFSQDSQDAHQLRRHDLLNVQIGDPSTSVIRELTFDREALSVSMNLWAETFSVEPDALVGQTASVVAFPTVLDWIVQRADVQFFVSIVLALVSGLLISIPKGRD